MDPRVHPESEPPHRLVRFSGRRATRRGHVALALVSPEDTGPTTRLLRLLCWREPRAQPVGAETWKTRASPYLPGARGCSTEGLGKGTSPLLKCPCRQGPALQMITPNVFGFKLDSREAFNNQLPYSVCPSLFLEMCHRAWGVN